MLCPVTARLNPVSQRGAGVPWTVLVGAGPTKWGLKSRIMSKSTEDPGVTNSIQFKSPIFTFHMTDIEAKGRTCQCNDILKGSIAANASKIWNNYKKNLKQIFYIIRTSQSIRNIIILDIKSLYF